ncbi:LacI family DNA-binding transcriptional regulator [Paraoerskovia marina]|uniref:LacI family DNA-binding transcriptional regulator n=1 Tax=Paraoerskovia marina TaxID=545619 RepID=UPI000492D357|nr:LacI family DNA-binding transcriptional regulator [Paraoerskovia marina]
MRTRLSDIAEQSGVSTATVSRVLNGKANVSAATRQAVLAAFDVLGYERPERLRTRSEGLVGLVIPELTNPVFPALAQAIEATLAQHGYTPLLCTQSPGGTTEDQYVETLLTHGVNGIIFVSGLHADTSTDMSRYQRITDTGVPVVLINGYTDKLDVPFVSPDDVEATRAAVRHLTSLGHRRVGLVIGPARFVPARRKIDGFVDTLVDHGLATDRAEAEESISTTLYTVEGGQAGATDLIDRGHTGIVCGSDLMALGAIRAARTRGLRVPGDVSVVGYDDSPLIAFTDPPLTTIRQPVDSMAQAAVSALLGQIQGTASPRSELLFRTELVVRESTGPAPAAVDTTP